MADWYYTKMGIQQGPVPEDELQNKIRRGEIGDSNLIWREGMADWKPYAQIPELQSGGSVVKDREGPPPMVVEAVPAAPSHPTQLQGDSDFGVSQEIPTYLAHSLVALAFSCVCMAFICIPLGLPFAIVALVYASKVDRLKAQGDFMGAKASSGNAKLWMIISFAMSALLFLVIVGFMVFAFTVS